MRLTLRPIFITSLVLATIACKSGQAQTQALQSPKVIVPTDHDFRYGIANVVQNVQATVVSIQIEKKTQVAVGQNPFEFFFGPGFAPPGEAKPQIETGLGSGVIVSADGYILTNNHVVDGASKITVTLWDGQTFSAKIVGKDEATDLAVIQILKPIKNLPVAVMGNSDSLKVGEWIIAIGNPFGLSHTVTTGIVSAKEIYGRGLNKFENFIQVDAAINPGNSGGALLDLQGKLVGINSAILSRTGGFQGIGFAIPIAMAQKVMKDLIEKGQVTRGWLGVGIQDLSPEAAKILKLEGKKGAIVTEVMPESPAAQAGIQVGDVLLSLNGRTLSNSNSLRNEIALISPNTEIELSYARDSKISQVKVKIKSRESDGNGTEQLDTPQKGFGADVQPLNEMLRKQIGISNDVKGVLVKRVIADSPAEKSGLEAGDLILRINQKTIENQSEFQEHVNKIVQSGDGLILVQRGNAKLFISVNLK